MSVLETLYVMFKGDASQLIRTNVQVERSVSNLKNSISTNLRDITRAFQLSPLLRLSYFTAFFLGTRHAAQFADQLDELSKALDVDVESLSAWSDAVKIGGGDVKSFQDTIATMTARLSDFAVRGKSRAAPFFKELGIEMLDAQGKARNFIDILPEIADSFSKISKSESLGIGLKMGLDEGTIKLLQRGRSEVEKLVEEQKKLGVVSERSATITGKFNDRWDNFVHLTRTLFDELNKILLPAFGGLFEAITDFGKLLISNKYLLYSFFGVLALIGFFISPWITGLFLLAAAFGLVYEDIKVFERGGQSAIGEFIKKFPILGELLKQFIKYLKFVKDHIEWFLFPIPMLIKTIFDKIKDDFDNLLNVFNKFGENLVKIFDKIVESFKKFKKLLGLEETNLKPQSFKFMKEEFENKNGEDLFNPFSIMNRAKNSLSFASSVPLNGMSSSSISSISNKNDNSKKTDITIGDINIQTQASSPFDISSEIKRHLNDQMRQTINNYDDGITI